MSRHDDLIERVLRAREDGMTWWEIKGAVGVSEAAAKRLVKAYASYAYTSTARVTLAAKIGKMTDGGMMPLMICERLGVSKNTVHAGLWVWRCAEARRKKRPLPPRPCWVE